MVKSYNVIANPTNDQVPITPAIPAGKDWTGKPITAFKPVTTVSKAGAIGDSVIQVADGSSLKPQDVVLVDGIRYTLSAVATAVPTDLTVSPTLPKAITVGTSVERVQTAPVQNTLAVWSLMVDSWPTPPGRS